ncbi:MAG: RDD family protein [Candidatus Melainabacteria bacterium]|nr:RDD family protein [Candidatus Melainabacteria bacterium]
MRQPDYLISTPENVDLHLELAGLGNRILACFVDTVLTYVLVLFIVIACLAASWAMDEFLPLAKEVKTVVTYYLVGAGILLIVAVQFGYYILFEGLWHGQTPGKRLAHIRVIESNGQPVSWPSIIIRNLLRVADMGLALVGLVIMLADRHERRIGDLAAGTLVIRERLPARRTIALNTKTQKLPEATVDIGRVSPAEYDLIATFLERREKMSANERAYLAKRLEDYFGNKLEMSTDGQSPELFLESLYVAYQSRAEYASEP